jgi:hypothetical protein
VFLDSSSITWRSAASLTAMGQGSFPPPALPGFSGTTSPSALCVRRCWPSRVHRWVRPTTPAHGRRLPLLRTFPIPCVPPSLPRWDLPAAFLASPAASVFPEVMAGRLPHWLFRGLLDVHSRCSPHGPLPPGKRPFLEVLQVIRRLLTRPECFRLEREFAGPDLPRGGKCTLSRHTQLIAES